MVPPLHLSRLVAALPAAARRAALPASCAAAALLAGHRYMAVSEGSDGRLPHRMSELKDRVRSFLELNAEDMVSSLPEAVLEPEDASRLRALRADLETVSMLFREHGFGSLQHIDPLQLFYKCLERGRLRTPAWKTAQHGARIESLVADLSDDGVLFRELQEHAGMVEISYLGSEAEIRAGLPPGWELLRCTVDAAPGEPASFVAVRREGARGAGPRAVLAVRGTHELSDVVTDALADTREFEGGVAHAGVARAADHLCAQHAAELCELSNAGYEVVTTGHSLGASVAAATAVRLRHSHGLDSVRCVCFAPPPTLDAELADKSTAYVTSVVFDDDLIPRLSLRSMLRLHAEVIAYDWTAAAKADARALLATAPAGLLDLLNAGSGAASGDDAHTSVAEVIDELIEVRAARGARGETSARREPQTLLVPGFIVHVFRSESGFSASNVPPEALMDIELSSTMLSDHLLANYMTAIESVADTAECQDERKGETLYAALRKVGLEPEEARTVVGRGVGIAGQVRTKLLRALMSRPDTS